MILTGQPFTEALAIDEFEVPYGHYILGNLNGHVVLKNMSIGDAVQVNYGQLNYNQILAFDQNWSRVANKTYNFTFLCSEDLVLARKILYADHAMITRLRCKGEPNPDVPWDWVEYGFIDPVQTKINNLGNTATLDLGFITVFEVSQRIQLQCP